ncbi:MAG: M20/M25/M40 family metallo-hydrolase [Acetobacteraceae bacterium]
MTIDRAEARRSLLAHLRATEAGQVAFLQALLRAPSANPPGDTRPAAAVVERFLTGAGAAPSVHAARPDLPNLVAHCDGAARGGHLVFNGHLDVFPPNDDRGWSGALRDGRLYGRGAADMKAGLAASAIAFAALLRQANALPGRVTFTAVSDEETGGRWGTRHLFETLGEAVRGEVCLNGEPSGLNNIRFTEKGTLRMTITVRTPGAHGGYPHLSPSAIRLMGAILRDLESLDGFEPPLPENVAKVLADPAVVAAQDAGLGAGASAVVRRVVFNAGVIAGGTKVNVLPDRCALQCEFRYPWGLDRATMEGNVRRLLARHPEAELAIHEDHSYPPSLADPDHPMVGILADVVERDLGRPRPVPCASLGGSDSRYWRWAGVPAFLYGPSPVTMGRADEHVSIDEFLDVARAHALAAFDWLDRAGG